MKLYSLFLIKFIFFFLFTSCAYFDEEEDKILPGKRERVFISDDKILKKANKRVKILPPKTTNSWKQQHQNVRNHLYHFKSNPNLILDLAIFSLFILCFSFSSSFRLCVMIKTS